MNKFGCKEPGSATVESALVMPLMLLLLLGIIEFGNAFFQYNILQKAVRDGARYAAEEACSGSTNIVYLSDELITATKAIVVFGSPKTGSALLPSLSVTDVAVTAVDLQHISVSASYRYQPLLGFGTSLPTFGIGDGRLSLNFVFRATVIMAGL